MIQKQRELIKDLTESISNRETWSKHLQREVRATSDDGEEEKFEFRVNIPCKASAMRRIVACCSRRVGRRERERRNFREEQQHRGVRRSLSQYQRSR